MADVIALGELLIDFSRLSEGEDNYPVLAAHPGGAPANFLAALSAYGISAGIIGKVGNDSFGHLLLDTLKKHGIDSSGVIVDDSVFTTLAFVTLDKNGERSFSFARKPGADTMLNQDELNFQLLSGAKVLHYGTLSMTSEPALTATVRAVEWAGRHSILRSFDPNLRRPLWANLSEAAERMRWGLSHADVIKISDEEVEFLYSCGEEEGAERILRETEAALVFVTCGGRGAYFFTRSAHGFVRLGIKVCPADTTGAGDIFGGAAMYGIIRSGKAPSELSEEELREITDYACTAASLSTERAGGISSVPSLAEITERRTCGHI